MSEAAFQEEVRHAILLYERAIGHAATRTWPMIAKYGEVGALSRLMVSADLQQDCGRARGVFGVLSGHGTHRLPSASCLSVSQNHAWSRRIPRSRRQHPKQSGRSLLRPDQTQCDHRQSILHLCTGRQETKDRIGPNNGLLPYGSPARTRVRKRRGRAFGPERMTLTFNCRSG